LQAGLPGIVIEWDRKRGLHRWAMMLARTANILNVIAFPKNQKARDMMTGAPAPVDAKQLKELAL
jgi:aspartyl-tRNA synthetase